MESNFICPQMFNHATSYKHTHTYFELLLLEHGSSPSNSIPHGNWKQGDFQWQLMIENENTRFIYLFKTNHWPFPQTFFALELDSKHDLNFIYLFTFSTFLNDKWWCYRMVHSRRSDSCNNYFFKMCYLQKIFNLSLIQYYKRKRRVQIILTLLAVFSCLLNRTEQYLL